MRRLSLILLLAIPLWAQAAEETYKVESAANNEFLLINGYSFAAKSACHEFEIGDEVVFLSGDPDGSCTEALILNLRTNQACDTWCSSPD
jgi:hypothetical protein